MRRFDEFSGSEMWVSDFKTPTGYEWSVVGADVYNSKEIGSGVELNKDKAIEIATEIYEDYLDGYIGGLCREI